MNFFKKLFSKIQASGKGFFLSNSLIANQIVPTPQTWDYLHSFHASSLVHTGTKKIADKIANTEWELYKLSGEKAKEIIQHPLLDLLTRPNPTMSGSDPLEMTAVYLSLCGNAYWYKARNGAGKVFELWSMRPDLVRVGLNPDGSVKEYIFKIQYGIENAFPAEDVIHFTEANPLSDYYGLGAVMPIMEVIMADIYAKKWNTKFFYNSARPDAILTTKSDLDEEEREKVREKWMEKYGTFQNAFNVAVLSDGLSYQQISATQKDMDFANMRVNNREDVLMALQVPKNLLGLTDEVNYASAQTSVYVFLSETIVPKLKKICAKINHSLVQQEFGFDLLLDFIDPTPQHQESIDAHYTALTGSVITVNEARIEMGYDPIEGGDDLYQPINLISIGTVPRTKQISSIEEKRHKNLYLKGRRGNKLLGIKEDLVKKIADKVNDKLMNKITEKAIKEKEEEADKKEKARIERRSVIKEMHIRSFDKWEKPFRLMVVDLFVDQAKRAIKKLKDSNLKNFKSASDLELLNYDDEVKLFEKKSEPLYFEMVKEAGEDAYDEVGEKSKEKDFNPNNPQASKFIQTKKMKFARQVNDTTIQKLKDTLSEGILEGEAVLDLSGRVKDVFTDRAKSGSILIARTETVSAVNGGTLLGYQQSGFVKEKEWLAVEDEHTRPDHQDADGQQVAVDDAFDVGGEELQYPGDPDGSPEEICNCRCTIAPVIDTSVGGVGGDNEE